MLQAYIDPCLECNAPNSVVEDNSNVLLKGARDTQGPQSFSRLALASFVCANLSLVGLLLGRFGFGVVYLFLAFIPAIITGHLARRRIKRDPGRYRNASMARYGLAIGYLGLFLSIFVILAMLFGAITIRSA